MNVLLCGLPCCGKSTIGRKLAERKERTFLDVDEEILKAHERNEGERFSCREIVLKYGESYFRTLETGQIAQLNARKETIIALGGGALKDNSKAIEKLGFIIYLQTPLDIVWERAKRRGLPAFLNPKDTEAAFFQMAQEREPFYTSAADLTINTERLSPMEIVEEILRRGQDGGKLVWDTL